MRGLISFFTVSRRLNYFLVFIIAFALRALPELLSGVYPVGFDALAGYIPAIIALPDHSPMKLFGWIWSPLAVYLLWFVQFVTGVDPYLLLKIAGPVFYGFLIVCFYYMLLYGLGWGDKKSFMVALLFLLQPVILRMGWDQLREELGLMFFFLLLAKTKCNIVTGARRKPLTVFFLSTLIVFSHQLAAILFFTVILWQLFDVVIKKDNGFLIGFVTVFPSAVIFTWQLYMAYFVDPRFDPHFVPIDLPSGTDFFAFTNYFSSDPRFLDGDYFKMLAYVGSLSLYCVVPLVPFALKGYFKDKVFTPMVIWLLVASYSIVFFPKYAFSYFWWWILLLPIPLTVYAGHGLERLRVFSDGRRFRLVMIGFLLLGVVAVGYASSVIRLGYPYAYTYMPSGLVESCVDFGDIPHVEAAFMWVNENIPVGAMIIVPQKLQGFSSMYSRPDLMVRVAPPLMSLSEVLRIVKKEGLMYAVYYLSEIENDENTNIIAEFGRIVVCSITDG